MDWTTTPPAETADRACVRCKIRKRRCDKSLPSCSLCLKVRQVCDYSDHPVTPQENEISDLRAKVQDLERLITNLSNQSSVIPTPDETISDLISETGNSSDFHTQASFLEPEIAHNCNPGMPAANIAVPENISSILGDRVQVNQISSHYFQSTHTWMPIISKQKLSRIIAGHLRADTALLLLCMKLLCHTPHESNARNAFLYTTAKQFSCSLETAGLSSLRTLQANLLISVYELGHAIYPAAYVSIGLSARQGIALGVHNHSAPQLPRAPVKWTDWEERRRVWWLILILDRIVTLGSYDRPLCTEDPYGTSYVPVDDMAWDQGEMVPPEQVLVSAPSHVMVSPFARLAQSANLAGRVIRHCDDDDIEVRDSVERFELLYRTTLSLLELITSTSTDGGLECSSQALCLSVLIKLTGQHSCDAFVKNKNDLDTHAAALLRESTQHAIQLMKDTNSRVVEFALFLEELAKTRMDNISPFVLPCLYQCATSLAWLAGDTTEESYAMGLSVCKRTLRLLASRWKLGDIYLKLLQVMEIELEKDAME